MSRPRRAQDDASCPLARLQTVKCRAVIGLVGPGQGANRVRAARSVDQIPEFPLRRASPRPDDPPHEPACAELPVGALRGARSVAGLRGSRVRAAFLLGTAGDATLPGRNRLRGARHGRGSRAVQPPRPAHASSSSGSPGKVTGPRIGHLVGGFAFAPTPGSTGLWRGFPDGELRLPDLVYSREGDRYARDVCARQPLGLPAAPRPAARSSGARRGRVRQRRAGCLRRPCRARPRRDPVGPPAEGRTGARRARDGPLRDRSRRVAGCAQGTLSGLHAVRRR